MESNTSLNSSLDRFIPLRGASYASFKLSHKHPRPASLSCIDYCRKFSKYDGQSNFMQYYHKKNNYKDLLVQTLFQSPKRVLYFSPEQKSRTNNDAGFDCDWPVHPRKKPLITLPRCEWDLSEFDLSSDGPRQKLDWGPGGFLAGFLSDCVYLFNLDHSSRELHFGNLKYGRCLKWLDENHLAMSFKRGGLDIGDVEKKKIVMHHSMNSNMCRMLKVHYIAYSRHFIITCHKMGLIQVWDHNLILISSERNSHKGKILSAKISSNERYLATNGMDASINIWSLPECARIYHIIIQHQLVTAMDWHPWKSSMLAVGRSTSDSFCTLWDVNKPSDIFVPSHPHNARVDCLTFNPISAELVVGFWLDKQSDNTEIHKNHNIVVQSNLNTIVDDINVHKGRTLYMLWDKEGRRLATVGAEENMAVCNFFGQEEKKKNKSKKISSIFKEGLIR